MTDVIGVGVRVRGENFPDAHGQTTRPALGFSGVVGLSALFHRAGKTYQFLKTCHRYFQTENLKHALRDLESPFCTAFFAANCGFAALSLLRILAALCSHASRDSPQNTAINFEAGAYHLGQIDRKSLTLSRCQKLSEKPRSARV
jgi:hypothetical protein